MITAVASSRAGEHVVEFDALGAHWRITTDTALSPEQRAAVVDRVERFDATWSRFRDDSVVARLARLPLPRSVPFPAEATTLFDLYDALGEVTRGAVDPLVGRDLELLGYDAQYRLTPDPVGLAQRGRRARWCHDVVRDGRTLTVGAPVVLDVGAVGKGLLVDLLVDLLAPLDRGPGERGHVVVDAGGDLRHRGPGRRRVGLEDPADPTRVLGVVELRDDAALCASAVNRRAWGEGLHHVLDGRTGRPVRDIVATWAVAGTAALADGLATAAFSTAPATLTARFGGHVVRLRRDGALETDPGFDGELFT